MLRFFLAIFFLLGLLYAEDISPSKYAKLVQKGEKVALKLCDEELLSKIKSKKFDLILQEIDNSKPCISLNTRNKKALAYFLMAGSSENNINSKTQINVPKKSKCPVCGMFVSKYPKWAAMIDVDKKKYYFDGVKDMMKFYIFDIDFPYDRTKINQMRVTDFYTLQDISAKDAFYVIGSDIFGPMGNELIPFLTKGAAENFMHDHSGNKIIKFNNITAKLVMKLDGIEYN